MTDSRTPTVSDKMNAADVYVLDAPPSPTAGDDLGHVPPKQPFGVQAKRFAKSLASKDAWFGDYDYMSLFIPDLPFLTKRRELPFYAVDERIPYFLNIILGLQHALAMVGGLVVPPLLLGGPAGANLGSEIQQYLISACLIWCAIGTAIQVSRFHIKGTKYYIGTGIINVTGTSFTFANVALQYLSQSYANGTCPTAEDGTKLPCPKEFGAILGTCTLTGLLAIGLAFVPPKTIRKMFPPLVTGIMITFIGASLVSSGVKNWAGGSGPCMSDHTVKCVSGSVSDYWGSARYIGLGFSCFITIILCEIFGSAFMKSASVFIGLVVGMVIAAATGYFNGSVIKAAPGGTFIWLHTFPLGLRGQLVLPMMASWCVSVAETIGNVTAACDVSRMDIQGETFMSRIQGGILADALSATVAGLATVPPLTTFAQNAGVIAITRNASRRSAYMCAFILFLMGIIGKFGAIFVAAPSSVIGGFTTFLFGAVCASGIRILGYAKWDRRDRFIATASLALGLCALTVPNWFSFFFTYSGNNSGLKGLLQAIVLIVEEPYLIAAFVAAALNATLPEEVQSTPDEKESLQTEDERKEWNQPQPFVAAPPKE